MPSRVFDFLTIFGIEVNITRRRITCNLVRLAGVLFDVSTSFQRGLRSSSRRAIITSSKHLPALKVIRRFRDMLCCFVVD